MKPIHWISLPFLYCIAQHLDFIYHQRNMKFDFSPLHQWLVIGTVKESQIMSGIYHLSESDWQRTTLEPNT